MCVLTLSFVILLFVSVLILPPLILMGQFSSGASFRVNSMISFQQWMGFPEPISKVGSNSQIIWEVVFYSLRRLYRLYRSYYLAKLFLCPGVFVI